MTWLHLTIGCILFIIEQALSISSTLLVLMTVTVVSLNDMVFIVFYFQKFTNPPATSHSFILLSHYLEHFDFKHGCN
jgi:hypothetical protein